MQRFLLDENFKKKIIFILKLKLYKQTLYIFEKQKRFIIQKNLTIFCFYDFVFYIDTLVDIGYKVCEILNMSPHIDQNAGCMNTFVETLNTL